MLNQLVKKRNMFDVWLLLACILEMLSLTLEDYRMVYDTFI
jgi:hypothetical protein